MSTWFLVGYIFFLPGGGEVFRHVAPQFASIPFSTDTECHEYGEALLTSIVPDGVPGRVGCVEQEAT